MKWQPYFNFFHNSVDTQKTGDPNFGGISNLKFFVYD